MASFKDTAGREWTVAIDPWGIKQVRAKTGVHLGKLLEDKLAKYAELVSDPELLVDVIFVLCSEQAEKRNVTDEQFGRALGGDALEEATAAFVQAFSDFCPSRLRTILKAIHAKAATVQTAATAKALEAINQLDVFSISATALPASSESIPQG